MSSQPIRAGGEHLTVRDARFRKAITDVAFVDSSGLGELLGAHQRGHRGGRRLVLVRSADTQVAQVLHLSALDTMMETVEDPRAAAARA